MGNVNTGPASSTSSPPLLHPSCIDPNPEENVMRAKLLIAAAAGLALLAPPVLAQTQASPPGGPPPRPPAGEDDDDHDGMGPRHRMMGPRHGLRYHRFGRPPGAEAGQLRLSPAIHVRRGDLVLDLECSVRDSVEDCAAAALRLLEHLESPPPRP
jgi:hypothetical protein